MHAESWVGTARVVHMPTLQNCNLPYRASVSTASSYLPEPMPVSAKMP
jgi:hypothetical protein